MQKTFIFLLTKYPNRLSLNTIPKLITADNTCLKTNQLLFATAVCRRRLDLAFVVDGSGSIGLINFKRTLNFIRHMVSSFVISPSQTRIALIEYNTRPFVAFKFGQKRTLRDLLISITRLSYIRGGTNTGRALLAANKHFFKGRSSRTRVTVLITDGKSRDNVIKPAKILRKRGIQVIVIGSGTQYKMRQLRQIASGRKDVFTSNFKSLLNIVRALKRRACYGELQGE